MRKRAPLLGSNEIFYLQEVDVVNFLNIDFTNVTEEQAANWFDDELDLSVAQQIALGRNFVQIKFDSRTNEVTMIMRASALRANCDAPELNQWLLNHEFNWAVVPVADHGIFEGLTCRIDNELWDVTDFDNLEAIVLRNVKNPGILRVEPIDFVLQHQL